MSFNNSNLVEGLNSAYKQRKENKKEINLGARDQKVTGKKGYEDVVKGLTEKYSKKVTKEEKQFKKEFTNNRKYIDEIMLSDNANNKALFLNVLNKRKSELNGYLMSVKSGSKEKQIIEEIKAINNIFTEYKDVISELERNGVIQKSKNNNLFRID